MKKGFTLVELIVTILIISLILTLAIPGILAFKTRLNKQSYTKKISIIEKSAVSYASGNSNAIKEKFGECTSNSTYCKCNGNNCNYEFTVTLEELIELGLYRSEENPTIISGDGENECDVTDPRDKKKCLDCNEIKITLNSDYSTSSAEFTGTQSHEGNTTKCKSSSVQLNNIDTFTIVYDTDGGVMEQSIQTLPKGKSYKLLPYIPIKDGNTFLGWSSNGSAVDYELGTTYTDDSDKTLKAIWSQSAYSITYYDGSDIIGTQAITTDTYSLNNSYTKYGYKLISWKDDSNVTYDLNSIQSRQENYNLYAVWEEKSYIVKYDIDDGVTKQTYSITVKGSSLPYKIGTDKDGSLITYTQNNRVFGGWTNEDGRTYFIQELGITEVTLKDGENLFTALWVDKTVPTCPTIVNYEGIYDGNNHTYTLNNIQNGIELEHIFNGTTSSSYVNKKDVGEYSVNIKIKENDDFASRDCGQAKITINNAMITFNTSSTGSTISGSSALYTKLNDTKLYTGIRNTEQGAMPTATKSNYTFEGWQDGNGNLVLNKDGNLKNVSSISSNGKWLLKTNLTLYAKMTANTYDISYELNGGTKSSGDMPTEYTYGQSKTINATLTKDGYTFNGWSTSSNLNDAKFTQVISSTDSGNKTYYAKYCQNCARVRNGSCTLNASIENICTYTTSCREGYSIINDGTYNPTCEPNVDTPYTVYHYLQNFNNSYDLKETEILKGTTSSQVTLNNLKKDYNGFSYNRGNTDESNSNISGVSIVGDGSTKIYLYYNRNSYSLTLNGGVGISNVSGNGSYLYEKNVTINATIKEGYIWKNWTGTNNYSNKSETFSMPSKNVTLTANAIPIKYNVIFTSNNGVCPVNITKNNINYDSEFSITLPICNGYIFNGWSGNVGSTARYGLTTTTNRDWTNNNRGKVFKNLTTKNDDTVTIIANWESKEYNVYFNDNYSSNPIYSTKTVKFNQKYNFPSDPTRSGHTFDGWYETPNGGKEITSDSVHTSTSDITFYAHWTKQSYTVTYNANGGENEPSPQYFSYGEGFTISNIKPIRTGYEFQGWSENSNAQSATYGSNQDVTGINKDITLYAVWKQTNTKINLSFSFNFTFPYNNLYTGPNVGYYELCEELLSGSSSCNYLLVNDNNTEHSYMIGMITIGSFPTNYNFDYFSDKSCSMGAAYYYINATYDKGIIKNNTLTPENNNSILSIEVDAGQTLSYITNLFEVKNFTGTSETYTAYAVATYYNRTDYSCYRRISDFRPELSHFKLSGWSNCQNNQKISSTAIINNSMELCAIWENV